MPGLHTYGRREAIVIYGKLALRVTVPFHANSVLHPKIVKQVIETIEEAG
jgi:predicted RNA binding protein YcfA (HicA-like mRNA interferase family)